MKRDWTSLIEQIAEETAEQRNKPAWAEIATRLRAGGATRVSRLVRDVWRVRRRNACLAAEGLTPEQYRAERLAPRRYELLCNGSLVGLYGTEAGAMHMARVMRMLRPGPNGEGEVLDDGHTLRLYDGYRAGRPAHQDPPAALLEGARHGVAGLD